jgi:hypothetical protein
MRVCTGEVARLQSYVTQRPPFDVKNPFLASIRVNRNLHKARSCSTSSAPPPQVYSIHFTTQTCLHEEFSHRLRVIFTSIIITVNLATFMIACCLIVMNHF